MTHATEFRAADLPTAFTRPARIDGAPSRRCGETIGGHLHEIVVRVLVDRIQQPVLLHDGTRVLHANQAAARLLLRSPNPATLSGRRLDELWKAEKHAADAGRGGQERIRILGDGPGETFVRAEHVPVFAGADGGVATFLDSTDRVTIAVDQLSALQRMQTAGVLSAGLAHEVASVLLPLTTAIEEARQKMDPLVRERGRRGNRSALDAVIDRLDAAATAGDALVALVRNFQLFMRPQPSRPVSVEESLCDPGQDVEQAVRMARPRVLAVASLVSRIEGTGMIRARPGMLTQVTLNLLNNATDALAAAGRLARAGHIDVRLQCCRGRMLLTVTDDGPGIPAQAMARLFQAGTTTKPGAGMGMGLAICQALVRRSGGEISVSSGANTGTTFLVSLPVAHPAEQVAGPGQVRANQAGQVAGAGRAYAERPTP